MRELKTLVIGLCFILSISCGRGGGPSPSADLLSKIPPVPEKVEQSGHMSSRIRRKRDARLDQVIEILWGSPLGRIYYSYLFGSPSENSTSRDVVDRVLSEGGKGVTKLSVLQLLTEELYDKELMGPEQMRRLIVLEGDLRQRQSDLATHPTEHMAYIAAGAFLAILPFGYPPFRHMFLHTVSRIPDWMKTEIIRDAIKDIPPTWSNSRKFEISWVLGTFFKYFGPFSFLYFYWFDWKESTRGHSIPYSIETVKSEEQFREFIDDIKDL